MNMIVNGGGELVSYVDEEGNPVNVDGTPFALSEQYAYQ